LFAVLEHWLYTTLGRQHAFFTHLHGKKVVCMITS